MQFVFRRGDYISIVFDGTQDVNEFIWYSTLLEDVAVLNNVDIIDSVQGATTYYPLLSLEIASKYIQVCYSLYECVGVTYYPSVCMIKVRSENHRGGKYESVSLVNWGGEGGKLTKT